MDTNENRRAEDAERLPAEKLEWDETNAAMRTAFERWVLAEFSGADFGDNAMLLSREGDEYFSMRVNSDWKAWQAASQPAAPAVDAAELGALKALAQRITEAGEHPIAIGLPAAPAILRIAALVAQQAARIAELEQPATRDRIIEASGNALLQSLMPGDIEYDVVLVRNLEATKEGK